MQVLEQKVFCGGGRVLTRGLKGKRAREIQREREREKKREKESGEVFEVK